MAYPRAIHPNTAVARAAATFLTIRRELGYRLATAEAELWSLARYLEHARLRHPDHDAVLTWAALHRGGRAYSAQRLEAVRPFLRYYASRHHSIDIPDAEYGRSYQRRLPHIYSSSEIRDLLEATLSLPPVHRLRPWTIRTLLGLLVSTGLRVGEALGLRSTDFDARARLLTVHGGKGLAARILPLDPSVSRALERYSALRDKFHPLPKSASFFLTDSRGTGLKYRDTWTTFRLLKRWLGWRGRLTFRIHDLRHTFAVNALLRWQRDGNDVRRLLPILGTYLGHSHPDSTYYYLSAVAEVMKRVAGADDPFGLTDGGGHAFDSSHSRH